MFAIFLLLTVFRAASAISTSSCCKMLAGAGGILVGGGLAVFGAPFVLSTLGFGSTGPIAGSVAAALQGAAVTPGSWFATSQALGMTGAGATAVTASSTIGASIGVFNFEKFCSVLIDRGICSDDGKWRTAMSLKAKL